MEQNKSPFVVTIMASPRPDGNVAKLLDAAERGAKDAGANVTRLTLSHMTLRPCIACMKCRTSGSCILPHDDAHDTATLLAKADSVIIATPVYWSSIPAHSNCCLTDWYMPSLIPLHQVPCQNSCIMVPDSALFAPAQRHGRSASHRQDRPLKHFVAYSGSQDTPYTRNKRHRHKQHQATQTGNLEVSNRSRLKTQCHLSLTQPLTPTRLSQDG